MLFARLTGDRTVASFPFTFEDALAAVAVEDRPANFGLAPLDELELPFPVVRVEDAERPETGEGQEASDLGPVEQPDGSWRREWQVEDWLWLNEGEKFARVDLGHLLAWPVTAADIRAELGADAPGGALVQVDGEWGLVRPLNTAPPEADADHIAEEAEPIFSDGAWRQAWAVRAVAGEELDALKARKWAQAKQARDAAIDAGVEVPGLGTFDSDANSRLNIAGAVTGAMLMQQAAGPFEVSWTLKDNSVATLDAPAMIGVGTALLMHVAAIHAHAQALRAAIDGAATLSALSEIEIAAGWPA